MYERRKGIKANATNPLDYFAGPIGANYTEQMQWRDAVTGKLLAASDYFSPMIPELFFFYFSEQKVPFP